MNVLQVIQEHCRRTGQTVPSSVQSSTDAQSVQMLGLMNEFLEDLQTRKGWQQNTIEKVHTSLAAEDQGLITTLCPEGYYGILPGTMFNRSSSLGIPGSLAADDWQVTKATGTGAFYRYRLRNNRLLFTPALPVNQTIAWEYYSSWFALVGATRKPYFTLDADTCTFSDAIMISWLRWRWKAEKGFDYATEFQKYEANLAAAGLRDEGPQSISMDQHCYDAEPGIFVPRWITP